MSAVIVEVGARRFVVPYECPCCGAVPDGELVVPLTPSRDRPVSPETAHALGFPYCRKCLGHTAQWDSVKNLETGIKVLGLLAGIVLALVVHWAAGLAAFVVAVALSVVIGRARRTSVKAACGESCACPSIALAYLGWSGNASAFSFESHVYAARFAEQNATKLVNVDPILRKVMEGHKLARLAVPTPAAAIRAVPAAATVSDWVDRIQTAPGRVARLDWLARSLDAFADPTDRHKLIVDVRADNIPEELRDEVVRQLEARLR